MTTSSGAPPGKVYRDRLGRDVRVATKGFDGRWVFRDTEYDAAGRTGRVSRPYYANEPIHWTTTTYDVLGRVIAVEEPDGSLSQVAYRGLTKTVTNALGQTREELKNTQDQVIRVTDALGQFTRHRYDAFGNLTRTIDPAGNVITNSYDPRGRKLSMVDPDMGRWTYAYNALGEMVRQTDAKGQVVTQTYDLLGRLIQRREADLISTWSYDKYADNSACSQGLGKLCEVQADNGMRKKVVFDTLGRPSKVTQTLDTAYTTQQSYDALGRPSTVTYPGGFRMTNVYNAHGYLSAVRQPGTGGVIYWRAEVRDAAGRVTLETLGNGLTTTRTYDAATGRIEGIQTGTLANLVQDHVFQYDALGNLTQRVDLGAVERFGYDALNRLTHRNNAEYARYDGLGNLVWKANVGTYAYPAAGEARPHAVTSLAGTVNTTFSYDANGNLLSGKNRALTWSSFNMPVNIRQGGQDTTFIYDFDHRRAKQTAPDGTETYYVNAFGIHYEKEVKAGVTEFKHTLVAGGQTIGEVVTSGGVSRTRYFHGDHLGSIRAVTDESGQVLVRYAFDPWGKRVVEAGDGSLADHGYTGHEMLDNGLIHMNGRVYDPVVGRFLSADPIIEAPELSQNYNRYSYVLNNPLSFTDPSGYCFLGCFWHGKNLQKWIRPVVAIAVAVLAPQVFVAAYSAILGPLGLQSLAAAAAAVTSGALSGYVATGTLQGALTGALTAGLFYGVGSAFAADGTLFERGMNAVGHAAVGCASASLGGGECGSGALSAFAGAAWSNFGHSFESFEANLISTTVVGGTTSVLAGDKFGNGAVTAAFGYLFNAAAHRVSRTIDDRAQVAYGETQGLYPQPGDQQSARDLALARQYVADISERNGHVYRDTAGDNALEQKQWALSVVAAEAAETSDLPSDVRYFFIQQDAAGPQYDRTFMKNLPIYTTFGPFRNVGGGDAARGNRTFIYMFRDP